MSKTLNKKPTNRSETQYDEDPEFVQNFRSLLDFDQDGKIRPLLDSPRSIEALKRQGLKSKDIIRLSKDQVMEMYKDKKFASQEVFDMFYNHLEERRVKKIKAAIKTREEVIAEERLRLWTAPGVEMNRSMKSFNSKLSLQYSQPSTISLVEREKQNLEKVKLRQTREIEKMIEYENKLESIQQFRESKEQKQFEKQRRVEQEAADKRRMVEEKRKKQEEDRHLRELEEEEANKKKRADLFEQEQERIQKEREKEMERRQLAHEKEEENKRKQEEYARQTQKLFMEQQQRLLEKREQMDRQEELRKEKYEEQTEFRKRFALQLQEEHHNKIERAKQKNMESLEKKREDFEMRQAKMEERRLEYEKEQLARIQRMKEESQLRESQTRKVIENNNNKIEQRRIEYYSKQSEMDRRREELMAIQAKFEAERMRRDQQNDDKRVKVKEQNDKIVQDRVNVYLQRIEDSEKRLSKAKARNNLQLLLKSNMDFMKSQDRADEILRMQQVQAYRRQKLLDKIERDNERTKIIHLEQENLLKMRLKMRDDMAARKQQLVQDFQHKRHKKLRLTLNNFSTRNDYTTNRSQDITIKSPKNYGGNLSEFVSNQEDYL